MELDFMLWSRRRSCAGCTGSRFLGSHSKASNRNSAGDRNYGFGSRGIYSMDYRKEEAETGTDRTMA